MVKIGAMSKDRRVKVLGTEDRGVRAKDREGVGMERESKKIPCLKKKESYVDKKVHE